MACIRSCLLYGCETWARFTRHVLEAARCTVRDMGQVYMACIRSCLLYRCETWARFTWHVLEAACCMGAIHGP